MRSESLMRYDLAIVGSGFAGSLLAMIARRLGLAVVLIERGSHPRVVIGESSTPLANLLLEELSSRYDLPTLKPLAKWGSWQRTHPEVACGLKRGFTFHHHILGAPAHPDPARRDQLLVAASPHNEIADTHWYRADLDHFLVRKAEELGVGYLDQVRLHRFDENDDGISLQGQRNGSAIELRAQFVVDATGPYGFLYRALGLSELELPQFPATEGLYSHFSGVGRLGDAQYSRIDGLPPYSIDDAAVHHVFDGGWIWVLQFNNGITSAGVAATRELAAPLRLGDGAAGWKRLLDLLPALKMQFSAAKAERPFTHVPRLSFRSSAVAGSKWAMLPSAAGFVDPLLSTGFPLTLLGVTRLAEIIERDWKTNRFSGSLSAYAAQTDRELLATARLVGSLYANMNNFDVFAALALLYFAAASFSEAARRLAKPELASSFLLCDDPRFGPACFELCERARQAMTPPESAALIRDILAAIEPFNVAGFGREERHNWYPVEAEDLLKASGKLGASREEIVSLLRRCGFDLESDSICKQERAAMA
jgi:FADH2 O2-dependent halogenase